MKTINYETSEFKLYINMIYQEAGMHEKAIKLLEENRKTILDKTLLLESLGTQQAVLWLTTIFVPLTLSLCFGLFQRSMLP